MALGISQKDIQNFEQSSVQAVIPPVSGSEVALANAAVPFTALASGAASVYGALGTAATSTVAGLLPSRETMFAAADAGLPPPMDIADLDPDVMRRNQAVTAAETVRQFAPDPRRTGTGAQILHGLVSGGARFIGGTVLTGTPIGGAALVGATEGTQARNELIANGVDIATADKLGLGSAVFTGAAAMLPGGFGPSMATRVLSGAAAQTSLGVVQRGMMSSVLTDAGYTEQASQYRPLDGANMMADAVLGAAFGLVHHAFAPAAVDSAHTIADANQIERSAGGPATDTASRDAVVDNHAATAEAMLRGDDVPAATKDVHVVPDPAQEAARQASAKATQDAGAEMAGARVEAPVAPEPVVTRTETAQIMTPEELEAKLAQKGLPKAQRAGYQMQLDHLRNPEAFPEVAAQLAARRAADVAKGVPLEAAPKLDPATAEIVSQAQEVLSRREGLKLPFGEDEDGNKIVKPANEALQAELDNVKNAESDGQLAQVAAACAARGL